MIYFQKDISTTSKRYLSGVTRGLACALGKASKEVNNTDSVFSQPFKFWMSSKTSTGGRTVDYYCDVGADVKIVKPNRNLGYATEVVCLLYR